VFSGRGFGVGLTVADLTPPGPEFGPPVSSSPALAQMLPVYARSAAEKAAELQRVQALKAELAAYEIELVAAFAADRPAFLGRRPGSPGAAVPGENTAPEGVSEFFADELAATLNCARATATVLTEHTLTLTTTLRATLAELAQGRLDWPRARTLAEELGWPVQAHEYWLGHPTSHHPPPTHHRSRRGRRARSDLTRAESQVGIRAVQRLAERERPRTPSDRNP
jgi:hypothetical protein